MRWMFICGGDGLERAGKVVAARMPEALVPKVGGAAGEEACGGGSGSDVVEITGGVTSEEHLARDTIQNRKANVVKFNVYGVEHEQKGDS
jgi:butyrate kinase